MVSRPHYPDDRLPRGAIQVSLQRTPPGSIKRVVSICSILGLSLLGWLTPGSAYSDDSLVEYQKLSAPAPEVQPVILEGAEKVYEAEGRFAPIEDYDFRGHFEPLERTAPPESSRYGPPQHGDYDSEAFAPAYRAPGESGNVSHGIH